MDIQKTVALYIELRAKKTAIKKKCDEALAPVNEAMGELENAMLAEMEEQGVQSFKTDAGTAYKNRRTSASLSDRDAFLNYVRENEAWELLDLRASKTAVAEFRDEYDELPDGVNWREDVTVGFRKS